MKKLLFISIFTFLFSSVFSQVDFQKGTLAEMFDKAKDQNKILMVDVMTDWCKWCIELDNKVYAKPEMYEFANKNQINYKIDAEKGEGVDFAKKYLVKGYPTVLFLNADGSEIDRIYGYVQLKEFVETMKDYNNGINTISYLNEKLKETPDDVNINLKMADKLSMLGDMDGAKKILYKILELDPQNTSGKIPEVKFDIASMSDKEHIVKNLQDFIDGYPGTDKIKDAYVALAEYYYYNVKDKENADKYYNQALLMYGNDEAVKSSYGQYLNAIAVQIAIDSTKSAADYTNALSIIDDALPYVKGSVNEASSYYIQAKLFFNIKEYSKASVSIEKALKIFDRKLYRDLKDKIDKELSVK